MTLPSRTPVHPLRRTKQVAQGSNSSVSNIVLPSTCYTSLKLEESNFTVVFYFVFLLSYCFSCLFHIQSTDSCLAFSSFPSQVSFVGNASLRRITSSLRVFLFHWAPITISSYCTLFRVHTALAQCLHIPEQQHCNLMTPLFDPAETVCLSAPAAVRLLC